MNLKISKKDKLEASRLESWDNTKDVLELLSILKNGNILEIGCGTGKIIEDLSKKLTKSSFSGVDVNPYFIQIARKKMIPNVEFINADASKMNLEPEKFDYVVFRDSLHEIRENQGEDGVMKALKEAYSALKKGGSIIIRDALAPGSKIVEVSINSKEMTKVFDLFIARAYRKINFKKNEKTIQLTLRDFLFFLSKIKKIQTDPNIKLLKESKHYTLEEYKKLLQKLGFSLVEIRKYKFPLHKYPDIKLESGDLPESYVMLHYRK